MSIPCPHHGAAPPYILIHVKRSRKKPKYSQRRLHCPRLHRHLGRPQLAVFTPLSSPLVLPRPTSCFVSNERLNSSKYYSSNSAVATPPSWPLAVPDPPRGPAPNKFPGRSTLLASSSFHFEISCCAGLEGCIGASLSLLLARTRLVVKIDFPLRVPLKDSDTKSGDLDGQLGREKRRFGQQKRQFGNKRGR